MIISKTGVINIYDAREAGIELERGELNNSGEIHFHPAILEEAILGPKIFHNLSNGTIWGTGTIDGTAYDNQGLMNPGIGVDEGVFTIIDSYNHSQGSITFEIGGLSGPGKNGGHDQVNVNGPLTLGGTCNINLINGYNPSIGDSFILMNCNGRTGNFATINFSLNSSTWEIEYTDNQVILNFICANVLSPEITGTPAFCPGATTTLDAGNFTDYLWSTGETTQTIDIGTAGDYGVTSYRWPSLYGRRSNLCSCSSNTGGKHHWRSGILRRNIPHA